MTVSTKELKTAIQEVKRILDNLEKQLGDQPSQPVDVYVRRREVLQQIYWNESMERAQLLEILAEHGTDYRWIGQQVKKGYLTVSQTPRGSRYSVTQKAVRDEQLHDEDAEIDQISSISTEAFAEDWDNDEDAVYDTL